MGLHNDTQDLDFLHPWAILPQSIYPLDLRGGTMSHVGGDLYGDMHIAKKLGQLSYTAYAGQRPEDPYGGFVLGLASVGLTMHSYGGWVQGEDLRWTTPLSGLMVGASMATHHITGHGELRQHVPVWSSESALGLAGTRAFQKRRLLPVLLAIHAGKTSAGG